MSPELIIGAVIFAVFAYLTYADRSTILIAWRSRNWSPATAEVVDMENNSFEIPSIGKYSSARSTRYVESQYTFKFDVKEVTYTSTCYSFGGHIDQYGSFSVGDSVTIYYDPADPHRAVVKRSLSSSILSAPLFCVLTLAWIIMTQCI